MEKMFAEMTVAEKFAAVMEVVEDVEMLEFLAKRKEMAGRKSTSVRKADPAVAERKASVKEFLDAQETPVFAKEVAEALGMTPGQARAALTALVKEGVAEGFAGTKSREAKTYAIAE